MPPDIEKDRADAAEYEEVSKQQEDTKPLDDVATENVPSEEDEDEDLVLVPRVVGANGEADDLLPLEDYDDCVDTPIIQRRVRTNFAYLEQPVRAYLQPRSVGKSNQRLACNNKGTVYLSAESPSLSSASSSPPPPQDTQNGIHEFCLLPQPNGTILIQSIRQQNRFLCSDSKGAVYASETRHENMEDWIIQECRFGGGFFIISSVSKRKLACIGNVIRALSGEEDPSEVKPGLVWSIDLTSGELCFMSLPCMDQRLRCDITGALSLSPNYKGWEGWRISEAGNGLVRISPWAHATHFLSCNERGQVRTTETERGPSELWSIEKGEAGSTKGVIIQSSAHPGRYLCFDATKQILIVTKHFQHFQESCVWQLDSLHQSTYYLESIECNRRLVGTTKQTIDSSRIPMKRECEEWRVLKTNLQGVVQFFSTIRNGYLTSDASGEVGLTAQTCKDGSDKWIVEEHDGGNVLVSQLHKRVLTCNSRENTFVVSTVVQPSNGNLPPSAFWRLDPKTPRQVTKEKMRAVGTAVAIGVATTVATPLVLGGAIGLIGITEVGVAGHVAVGSIRAAEALSTISRITFSSSQLISHSQSSVLSSAASSKKIEGGEPASRQSRIGNRPFCDWRSW